LIKALIGYIVSLLVIITMFAIVLQDFNEQMEINKVMITMLKTDIKDLESVQLESIKVEPHKHSNEMLVKKDDYEKDLYNLNWQLKAIEERVIELQRYHSP